MNGRMLVALLAITALKGLQAAALAADAKVTNPKGHATFTFTVRCTTDVAIKDANGSGKDTITITFTETQECELERSPHSPVFAPHLLSWKSNVSAAGGGKYVYNNPKMPPDIYHYVTPKQFEEHICNWYNGMIGVDLPYDWFVCIGDFVLPIIVGGGEIGGGPALGFAAGALLEGAGGGRLGAWSEAAGQKPEPLGWRFALPKGLSTPKTCAAQKIYTGTTRDGDTTASTTITVDYDFHFMPPGVTEPEKPKVELQEIDQKWLPKEDNSLTATVKVTGEKPATAFQFKLYGVSRERGTYCNSADDNTDPDLSFVPQQGDWKIETGGEQSVATSDTGGRSASIEIACHDWGAWGKLQAQAKIEGKWQPAKVTGTGYDFVRIPYDQDDDHIADYWQEQNGVSGKAATDDSGKQPTDQANDGDGLSLYEDYRGFMTLNADKKPTRLDPRQKVLFVLDNSGYFKPDLWEQASGIKAYLLSRDMTRMAKTAPDGSRRANFWSKYARNGDKYCVVVTKVAGSFKDKDGDQPIGVTNPGGNCPACPRDVTALYLYPDNMRDWLTHMRQRLEDAIAHPDSEDARAMRDMGLPQQNWAEADAKLKDQAWVQQLVDQTMRQTAIHEMGHACGLPGHVKDQGNPHSGEGTGLGNKSCPMYYSDNADDLRYIIKQVLLAPNAPLPMSYSQFCKGSGFDCWGHLNVKDN